jgi:tetratricopeptide (TPR) repeat protein
VGLVAAMLPLAAGADEVYLKSGGQLSGRIVKRDANMIEVDIGAGQIAVATSTVLRIEEGKSPLHEFEEKASRIPAGDANAWVELGDWASARGLGTQAREAYNRALSASPGDARANTALGNVQVGGRWVSEDQGYRERGYVRFEGEWITPAEHEAILRERAAEAEQERARVADARVQEAEARAQEAEERARAAEAKAQEQQQADAGLPLWYGWGVGPVSWSTGSIAVQPVVTPRMGVPR